MEAIHFDYKPMAGCKNPDSYGEICVKCNKCERFTYMFLCRNCLAEKESAFIKPEKWGYVEFYNMLRAPICDKCLSLFTKEEIVTDGISHQVISCKVADFETRKGNDG